MTGHPSFIRKFNPSIYELSTLPEAGVQKFWVGYRAAEKQALGATVTPRNVWENIGGYYLFLGDVAPNNWTAFLQQLDEFIPALTPQGELRCLWIENPNAAASSWRMTTLAARATGTGRKIIWTVQRAVQFLRGHYGFGVDGLSKMQFIDESKGGGIKFSGGGDFSGPGGSLELDNASITIPFSGPQTGGFACSLLAPPPGTAAQPNIWGVLNIGLQFSAPPSTLPQSQAAIEANKIANHISNNVLFQAIFKGQTKAVKFDLNFDHLNLSNPERTALIFAQIGHPSTSEFSSYLRTTLGHEISLTPMKSSGPIPTARFVFGASPATVSGGEDQKIYHLSPDGAFALTVKAPSNPSAVSAPHQMLMGLSGLEYVEITKADSHLVLFRGGQPAFAQAVDDGAGKAANVAHALTDHATTSHAAILPKSPATSAAVYFAQPKEAPIYSGKHQIKPGFLDYNAMPAATLGGAAPASPPPVFPMGVFAGLNADLAPLAKILEVKSIAPFRRYKITEHFGVHAVAKKKSNKLNANAKMPPELPKRRVRAKNDPLGITPQGLVAELTPSYNDFDGLYLGNMPHSKYPKIDLTAVHGDFKDALQSNQLFFVAANVDTLMAGTSVSYRLVDEDKPLLRALKVPDAIITAVYSKIAKAAVAFPTEHDFVTVIGTTATPAYLPAFLQVAGILRVEMDGWTFQLSPRAWRGWPGQAGKAKSPEISPTFMIVKYCNHSLLDMIENTTSWAWPDVAIPPTSGKSIIDTQSVILDIFTETKKRSDIELQAAKNSSGNHSNAARLKQGASQPYTDFYKKVVTDPSWNGILFLNAPIEVSEMPKDLQFLTAGIEMSRFYAHHVGFSQTPFHIAQGKPVLEQTAAFGLIDYVDKVDLYAEKNVEFDFKTMQLRAQFANAALSGFSAQVQLLINQLFADFVTKFPTKHGNNLVLNGSYQRIRKTPVYSFVLADENAYQTQASVLYDIPITHVQLQTRQGAEGTGKVTTDFGLSGVMKFMAQQEFDLFSFGPENNAKTIQAKQQGLRFSGLIISMSFNIGKPNASKELVVRDNKLSFDHATSQQRPQSLVSHFPLTLTSLQAVDPPKKTGKSANQQTKAVASPEDLGFVSISAPMAQVKMEAPWYGLIFTLDLGTLGALMGSAGLSVQLIAAWKPGSDPNVTERPQYIGIRMPTAADAGLNWSLQGVLNLGFKNFQMQTYIDAKTHKQVYLLKLHQLALSILGMSFPPGNNDVILFGNPDQTSASKLGWYAAYAADKKDADKVATKSGSKRPAPAKGGLHPVMAFEDDDLANTSSPSSVHHISLINQMRDEASHRKNAVIQPSFTDDGEKDDG